jgi:hypothetical protein
MHKNIRLARSMADELACPAFAAVADEWLTRAADLGSSGATSPRSTRS